MRDGYSRVLVTGGCGFIGTHLVRALSAAGHTVTVLDDLSTGRAEPVVSTPGVRLVRGNVLDPRAVAEAAVAADLVVHLAGIVGMRLAVGQAVTAHQVATAGTSTVLDGTGDAPIVLVSSSAAYGLGDGRTVMSEDVEIDRAVPLAYDGGREGYATGKWDMEQLGMAAANRRPVVIVRPFNVVGHGQRSRYGMVLPTFLRQAASGQSLTVYGDGTQRRCFSDVAEFNRALLRLARTPDAAMPGANVHNIGSTEETTIFELAELVLAATGGTAGIQHVPYDSVFPGRVDVAGRVPSLVRLHRTIGATHWLSAKAIVANML